MANTISGGNLASSTRELTSITELVRTSWLYSHRFSLTSLSSESVTTRFATKPQQVI